MHEILRIFNPYHRIVLFSLYLQNIFELPPDEIEETAH